MCGEVSEEQAVIQRPENYPEEKIQQAVLFSFAHL
jgi:hypothetical protein